MGQNAKSQTLRGYDVQVRLFKNGLPLDIIEAEEIDIQPVLVDITSNPVSLAETQHDTHQDGVTVAIKAVRKGNGLLKEILAQMRRNYSTGKRFEKYTIIGQFKDINTGQTEPVKVVDATLLDPSFAGGGVFGKSTEDVSFHGHLQ